MIEYNNTGVRFFDEGGFEGALTMFRAALERKLAWDSAIQAKGEGHPVDRCVTPDILIPSIILSSPPPPPPPRAVLDYGNKETATAFQQQRKDEKHSCPLPVPFGASPTRSTSSSSSSMSSLSTATGTTPPSSPSLPAVLNLLHRHAFGINDDQHMITASAIIIFNIALVHQIMDAKSIKAGQSYQIAACITTMQGNQPTALHQAIMQNLLVWVSENSTSTFANTTTKE